ncbi:hypothetical protein MGALJ_10000 [Mycobacterium gallinarum]|uniref:4Fe-4S Wbl-type domain-containing protein n=1 Tax=Mycobacterium gallinarum TaxID=39689 RepID=A0A9W4FDT9_9MYCO|nr:WhiB family transcriptional regulator [Mycobacterium gallinarum]BBY91331.1 hypothetical protein MGALJ_10000 [Mycobacterium gallinarum]
MSEWNGLVNALFGIPDLAGAACWGRWDLFDPEREREPGQQSEDPHDRHQLAVSICLNECPVLDQCRAWVDSLKPSQRPIGVIAGTVRYQHKKREAA